VLTVCFTYGRIHAHPPALELVWDLV